MYFFLLSPNNSGSTVVAQFLASYMKDAYLPREGTNESQNLPEIRRLIGRRKYGWNEHESLPWPEIDSLLRQRAASESKNWIIEKTPSNIIRTDQIHRHFFSGKAFIGCCLVSNPFSFVASTLNNYHKKPITIEDVKERAQKWVENYRRQE